MIDKSYAINDNDNLIIKISAERRLTWHAHNTSYRCTNDAKKWPTALLIGLEETKHAGDVVRLRGR